MYDLQEKAMEIARRRVIQSFSRIGDECVSEAVESGNYTDRTCNLRSSIGYMVADEGEIVAEGGFWNLGGDEGPAAGREKASELAGRSRGLSLVLVAGMPYAQYVADKGFNVIDSAEILARQLVSQLSRN
jgi:hypothetical protein